MPYNQFFGKMGHPLMKFANRLRHIEPFRVVSVLERAKQLEMQGKDIVRMEAGEPDFATAQPIIDAGCNALRNGATHYSQAQGLPQLKDAIAQYYLDEYGVSIDPKRVLITPGASGALQLLSMLLINQGDGVLMSDPGYPCNRNFIRLMGGQEQLIPVDANDNFQLKAPAIERHWQSYSTSILLANPSNPTGTMLSHDELAAIARLSKQKSAHLIVDELYHGLCYEKAPSTILSMTNDAFVVSSFSKYFGMTGWRLGWMVVPEHAVEPLNRLAQNLFISMSTVAQYAALAAFDTDTRAILDERKAIFKRRRDFVLRACDELNLRVPCKPEGAFYVYAQLLDIQQNSEVFCKEALENHGIAMTPGNDFGIYRCDDHIRLSYTTSMSQLEKGMERLARIFK